MDVTPRRYRTGSISYRGVITPRHKYPRYVHSILAGRSRDILHTVTWNVKTETSSYLRDVIGSTWANFIPNSYPPNSLISEITEIRELFFISHSSSATLYLSLWRARFFKISNIQTLLLLLPMMTSALYSRLSVIMKRHCRGGAFNPGIRKARLFTSEILNFDSAF
jgi:hypothetical protein